MDGLQISNHVMNLLNEVIGKHKHKFKFSTMDLCLNYYLWICSHTYLTIKCILQYFEIEILYNLLTFILNFS
jgi:hypothetical protein